MNIRLDKFVSHSLNVTRSIARDLIKKGKITIPNKTVLKNDMIIASDSEVLYDGKILIYEKYVYIMLNKKKGYVSANKDNYHKTVLDLIGNEFKKDDLSIVGRLDIDVEGFILLTNDGPLNHYLTSPKNKAVKKYYLETNEEIKEECISILKEGIVLTDEDGEKYKTKEAMLEIVSSNKAYLSISEGKYHQVKKMMKYFGINISYLKRVSIGCVNLDETLESGCYRELTLDELNKLKSLMVKDK